MAEARREEEEEGERRDLRDVRNRVQPADYSERTKPDHFHSSQGPLSSIRAAIKRTRTNSQSDHTRDRRRPEITIISAEPLASNNWFPGTSVVFSPPPQPGWSVGIQPVSKPPPSYDQVIKETQEEHSVKPTAAPRQSTCTTSSATQTDPVREDTVATAPQYGSTPPSAKKRSAGKKPQKPPRPTLPKAVDGGPAAETVGPSVRKVATSITASTNTGEQSDSKSEIKDKQVDSTHTCTRSVTVYWDIPANHPAQPLSAFVIPAESAPSSSDSEHTERPVPLPRIKSRKQAVKEDEGQDQTLVKLVENCENVKVTSGTDAEDVSSNKYLKELLEVFSVENECEEKVDVDDRSDESSQGEDAGGEMSTGHSQRNIQARIKAFETQAEDVDVVGPGKPEPLPRKTTNRPSVAAKPSIAVKPQFNHSVENDNQNVPTTNNPQTPTPAPRPLPPRKPVGLSVKEELDTLLAKGPVPHRSRPSMLTRANSIHEEETLTAPPTPPVKPVKEPLKPNLNINNHNSTSMIRGSEFVDSLSSHIPVKPQHNVDSNEGSFSRQSVTRRPTTIRVPSRTDSYHCQDSPPPLPSQKPIGSLNPSVNLKQSLPPTPTFPSQEAFDVGSEPSLPPRRIGTSKKLPPRPPPAKVGPGRPPPPSLQATGRSHSAPQQASPKPQGQKPRGKGPVLPPRPNPGHRLYNKYTLQLPHGITASDYNGNNTGELSFQKNEVLLLLEEIDHNTFECQVGDARGRVHKSRMKVITPLDTVSKTSPSQSVSPRAAGSGLKVQAIHEFTPEGPGELGLRAGDVVSMVERVDSQWYRGTCRGSTGYFPVNFVTVLSDSPNPLPERKAKPPSPRVSGPRCVARFDFEGEHTDELSFSEGDVIQLKEYAGQDWARGQIGALSGIFPLNFVEVIEDLPDNAAQAGMVASPSIPAVANQTQASPSTVEWMVALYDYAGNTDGDLSFQQGDCILVTQHLNDEWSCGRLNGREGMFPRAFVESSTAGQQSSDTQQNRAVGGGARARALFDFTSDCDEELSLKVGEIITNLESIDEEWFLGDLRGKRALVPKNYVQVL